MRWLWREYGDDPEEPHVLERLIDERAHTLETKEDEISLKRDAAFLKYVFHSHLTNYRAFAGKYGFAFVALSITAIASGLLSSGIAAGWSEASWARWVIMLLGLVTGVVAATNQAWRPGEKSVSRMRGANALRDEGWAFVQNRGRYRRIADEREAFGIFVDEVLRIVKEAAAVDEARVEGHQAPR